MSRLLPKPAPIKVWTCPVCLRTRAMTSQVRRPKAEAFPQPMCDPCAKKAYDQARLKRLVGPWQDHIDRTYIRPIDGSEK